MKLFFNFITLAYAFVFLCVNFVVLQLRLFHYVCAYKRKEYKTNDLFRFQRDRSNHFTIRVLQPTVLQRQKNSIPNQWVLSFHMFIVYFINIKKMFNKNLENPQKSKRANVKTQIMDVEQ